MNPTTMTRDALTEFFAELVAVSGRTGLLILALVALRRIVRRRIPAQMWFAVWVVVAVCLAGAVQPADGVESV